jgi:hypothetical protein
MFDQILLPVFALIVITIWMAVAHAVRIEQSRRQHDIASRGECCEGKVIAVQRPFMMDTSTRLYFEFAPPGAPDPVRCCHVEHRAAGDLPASLPAAGTSVTVHYLPEQPHRAVIGKLVSTL